MSMLTFDAIRRSAHLARRVVQSNVARLDYPLKLNWALTYWCQYKCQTCNIWQRRPVDELTTPEVVRFIQQNPDISWVDLTGGEIFLREDIEDIFDAIASHWHRLFILHFPTNGFQTERIVTATGRLERSDIPHVVVTVSVDGDEMLNDQVRGIKGGYRRQVETFKQLRKMERLRVVFGVTLSGFNAGRFEQIFGALRTDCPGIGIDDVHLNLAQVSQHYYGNAGTAGIQAPRDQVARDLQFYRSQRTVSFSAAHWLESKFLRELDLYLESGVSPMPCHALRSSCFIDPWGTVFPCITYSRALGRLRESGLYLQPLWQSREVQNVQREIWAGECPQCWTACEAYQSIMGNLVRPAHRNRRAQSGRHQSAVATSAVRGGEGP